MTSGTDAGAGDWPPGSRLERWSQPQRILTTLSLADESEVSSDPLHGLLARRQKEAAERDQEHPELTTWDIVQSSKEAVYREGDDGEPIVTFIQFSLNLESGYIELSRS